jgi:CBS domain-containing protein
MWVCAAAFLVGKRWSIYEKQVSTKLWPPAHSSELAHRVFSNTSVAEVFSPTRKFVTLPAPTPLPEILDATERTRQRVFPVCDADGRLVGSFRIDDLTHALHEPVAVQHSLAAIELCQSSALRVRADACVEEAQGLLSQNHVDELLVVDAQAPDRVVGIITSADILLAYTRRLSVMRRPSTASFPP